MKKQQTPHEMILSIMRVMESPAAETATLHQIRECAKEMALHPEDPLRWALEFAAQDLAAFSAAAWLDVTLKLAAFRTNVFLLFGTLDGKEPMPVGGRGFFPSREQICEVYRAFNSILSECETDERVEFRPSEAPTFQLCRVVDDKQKFKFNVRAADFVTDCKIKFMTLLGDFSQLVRVCSIQKHGCGRRFLASRVDKLYCSIVCANRAATRERRARLRARKQRRAS
jgi:hypothetical protein